SAGNPQAGGAAGIVAGYQIRAVAEELGYVETFLDFGDQFFWRSGSGLKEVVAGAYARRAGQSAGGVTCGLEPQLFRGVGVHQVRGQHTVLDDYRAACRDAFTIEGAGAKAAGDGAVVDDGDVGSGDFLPQLASQERRAAVDRVTVHAFENVLED